MDDGLFDAPADVRKVDRLLDELYKTDGWPQDPVKDRAFLTELVQQYPLLDLKDEFGAFRVWLLQQPDKERERMVKSRGRLQRLRNWCSRAGKPRRATGKERVGERRTSTAARPVEAFGDESSQSLSRW